MGEKSPTGQLRLRHPWAIRDRKAELAKRSEDIAFHNNASIVLRDGIEFVVNIAQHVLTPGRQASLQVVFSSLSYLAPVASVDEWMAETNVPPSHNPIRMTSLFAAQYPDGMPVVDDLGDACIGEHFRMELCIRVATCINVKGEERTGGGRWNIAVPVQGSSVYRFEVLRREPKAECFELLGDEQRRPIGWMGARAPELAWWAPPVAEHAVKLSSQGPRFAAYVDFNLLYVNKLSWWWGQQAKVQPVECWAQMVTDALIFASRSDFAQPTQWSSPAVLENGDRGLWLEFGVGSGKTTAVIAWRMKTLLEEENTMLHGFDSFEGLPTAWDNTKLKVGTFGRQGKVPEHLSQIRNVKIHVGLFSKTLTDLDEFGGTPVAFAHVDVDLYSSAVEVLTRLACQLVSRGF